MSERPDLNSNHANEIERLLAGLELAPLAIERDALFFRAGRMSTQRRSLVARLAWPLCTAALAFVCCGLGWAWVRESTALQAALLAAQSRPVVDTPNVIRSEQPVLAPAPTGVVKSPVTSNDGEEQFQQTNMPEFAARMQWLERFARNHHTQMTHVTAGGTFTPTVESAAAAANEPIEEPLAPLPRTPLRSRDWLQPGWNG
jgi:hypothetical protein